MQVAGTADVEKPRTSDNCWGAGAQALEPIKYTSKNVKSATTEEKTKLRGETNS